MFRARILVLGCAAALLAACSDSIVQPTGSLPPSGGSSEAAQLQLSGVLEAMDETQYGLRLGESLVPLFCSPELAMGKEGRVCPEELESAVGQEVRVWGIFRADGVFAISSYEVSVEDR